MNQSILLTVLLGFFCLEASNGLTQTIEQPINDADLENMLRSATEQFMQNGKTIDAGVLRAQLKRAHCNLRLPASATKRLSPSQAYVICRDSIIILGTLYKCPKCEHWHVGTSTAFAIAPPDVFATSYHAFNNTNEVAFVGMNRRQQIQPVQEILAANEIDDIAIIRIPGMEVRPLALCNDAPVGTPITLISHADHHFYLFTQGTIARYSERKQKNRSKLTMEITADFCKGSSGGPVLDELGNVTGMVASTRTVLYEKERPDSVQMVFKECVPAASILKLIRSR